MSKTLQLPCPVGSVSDGYHTFNELYDHRAVLFMALANSHRDLAWKSWKHEDGSMFDDMFIVGMDLPTGTVTYHIESYYWGYFLVEERDTAPTWDGHTPQDVVSRLKQWVVDIPKESDE